MNPANESERFVSELRAVADALAGDNGGAGDELRDELVRARAAAAGYVTVERYPDGGAVVLGRRRPGAAGSAPLDLPDGTSVEIDRAVPTRVCGVTITTEPGGALSEATAAVVRALYGAAALAAIAGGSELALAPAGGDAEAIVRRAVGRLAVLDAEFEDRVDAGLAPSGLWHAEAAVALAVIPNALGLGGARDARARAGADALRELALRIADAGQDWRVALRGQHLARALTGVLGGQVPPEVEALASFPEYTPEEILDDAPVTTGSRWLSLHAGELVAAMGDARDAAPPRADDEVAILLAPRVCKAYGLEEASATLRLMNDIAGVEISSSDPSAPLHELWLRAFRPDEEWSIVAVAPFVAESSEPRATALLGLSPAEAFDPAVRFDITDAPSRPHPESPLGLHLQALAWAVAGSRAAAVDDERRATFLRLSAKLWAELEDPTRARLAHLAAEIAPQGAPAADDVSDRDAHDDELSEAYFDGDHYEPREAALPEYLDDEYPPLDD